MEIATFTNGKFTLIGYKSGEEQKFKTIDSRFLYQDPDKLVGRYKQLISNLFGIKKLNKDDQIIFAISGTIDDSNKEIVESKVLNDISFSKYFNRFNFIKAFGPLADEKNIHIISDSRAVSYGALLKAKIEDRDLSLCLSIDESISLMLIKDGAMISHDNALIPPGDKSSRDLIGDRGIDYMLNKFGANIATEYSKNLSKVISYILSDSMKNEISCKNIFIHTNKFEYIVMKTIKKIFPHINFYITNGADEDKYLPLGGSFAYLSLIKHLNIDSFRDNSSEEFFAQYKYIVPKAFTPQYKVMIPPGAQIANYYAITKIIEIEFYSDKGLKISEFDSFDELKTHWTKTKPIASEKSYYVVNYMNKTKIKVYLANLNSITDLQKLKF